MQTITPCYMALRAEMATLNLQILSEKLRVFMRITARKKTKSNKRQRIDALTEEVRVEMRGLKRQAVVEHMLDEIQFLLEGL